MRRRWSHRPRLGRGRRERARDVHTTEQRRWHGGALDVGRRAELRADEREHHVFDAVVGAQVVHRVRARRAHAPSDTWRAPGAAGRRGSRHRPRSGRVEQPRLGREVRVHVDVEVEVVVREVGEARRREQRAVDPAARARATTPRCATTPTPASRRRPAAAGGRSPRAWWKSTWASGERRAVDQHARRADHPRHSPAAAGDRLEQVRGGGLAVGPGDAEAAQRATGRRRGCAASGPDAHAARDAATSRARAAARRAARPPVGDRLAGEGVAVDRAPGIHAKQRRPSDAVGDRARAHGRPPAGLDDIEAGGVASPPRRSREQYVRRSLPSQVEPVMLPDRPGARAPARRPARDCMIRENTGAATVPPKNCRPGSSITTMAARRGLRRREADERRHVAVGRRLVRRLACGAGLARPRRSRGSRP